MKRTVLEKSVVAILFVLVIILFSFAQRDTQKLFEKYNTKPTVQTTKQTVDFTADALDKTEAKNSVISN